MIDAIIKFKQELITALLETFNMLLVAMIFTLVIGLILGIILYLTKKDGIYQNKIIYTIISTAINILKSIPFILFIIVIIPFNRFLIGTGFGVYASMIPLSLVGIATFARLAEQSFLDLNKDIYETSYALGSSKIDFVRYFMIKESRSSLVLNYTQSVISILSYSTVMGVIGGGGLGYLAISEGYHNFNYSLMWVIIIIMIIMVQLIQLLGSIIAKKIDKK